MEIKLKCSKYIGSTDYKEIVKNLFDFKIGSVLTDIIKITASVETKAFLLLYNSTKNTFTELSKSLDQEKINNADNLIIISSSIGIDLKKMFEEEIILTKEFFEDITYFNPNYLTRSYKIFEKYLTLLNIEITENLNYEYYYYYRNNLEREFQENNREYTEIVNFFKNPIQQQNSLFLKLLDHYISVKKYYTDPLQFEVQDSKETLKDLYVEPYFNIFRRNGYNLLRHNDFFETSETGISVHNLINDFFIKGKKYPDCKEVYNMMFVLGQPGQGKTSFCYKVINDYLRLNNGLPSTPLIFVKIRELVTKDFIDNPFEAINDFVKLNINFKQDKCLLILDGLDEAFMSGGLNDGDLRNLYDRLNKTAKHNADLKIILTSRLNYLKLSDSCIDGTFVIQLRTLSNNQIKDYANRFMVFYPNNRFVGQIEKILVEEKYSHILELLQQAVLIYFIAISDIDIEEKDSKTILFDKIFSSLAKRSWDKNGQLSYIKSDLRDNYDKYERLLKDYIRNIAFEIYQSKNLYITVDKLQSLEATSIFIRKCFDEDLVKETNQIKEISKYLLISFYFQESKNDDNSDTAIEFFHNSLWEYLTAEFFWEKNKTFLRVKDEDEDFILRNKNEYFQFLDKLIGNKIFNPIVRKNLEEIIENEDETIKSDIFKQSHKNFGILLENDFLLKYDGDISILSSFEKVVNIFELYWTFYYKSNVNELIQTNSKLNYYLFSLSFSFYANYNFKNIVFNDDLYTIKYLEENIFNDIKFNKLYLEGQDINSNIFNNVEFDAFFSDVKLTDNEFNNVVFKDCIFSSKNIISNNVFKNIKLINCKINDEKFIDNLLVNNSIIDVDFIETHSVTALKKNVKFNIFDNKFLINYKPKKKIKK